MLGYGYASVFPIPLINGSPDHPMAIINHIDQYYDLIGYYQTGDVPGRREPYTGEMNYQNIFRHLHKKGYKGLIGLEHGMSQQGAAGFDKVVESYRQADSFQP